MEGVVTEHDPITADPADNLFEASGAAAARAEPEAVARPYVWDDDGGGDETMSSAPRRERGRERRQERREALDDWVARARDAMERVAERARAMGLPTGGRWVAPAALALVVLLV